MRSYPKPETRASCLSLITGCHRARENVCLARAVQAPTPSAGRSQGVTLSCDLVPAYVSVGKSLPVPPAALSPSIRGNPRPRLSRGEEPAGRVRQSGAFRDFDPEAAITLPDKLV
jgi:hypothetical protein